MKTKIKREIKKKEEVSLADSSLRIKSGASFRFMFKTASSFSVQGVEFLVLEGIETRSTRL